MNGRNTVSEDAERTLVFVDMLGASALTEEFPTRLIHSGPDEAGFESTSTSDTSNRFNRFSRVLDVGVHRHSLYGRVQAMLFSDCAFLEFGSTLVSAMVATELMRDFILAKVPVRMGIGRGTFYTFKFSTDITDSTVVTRSLFAGTAVVRAVAAERCGGKGLRVFVHPSVKAELSVIHQRVKTMMLVKPCKHATWELDYLYEQRPAQQNPSAEEADRGLFEAVLELKEKYLTAPMVVRRHYIEALKAMNRMRKTNGRPPINIRVRKQARVR
jgi:hypothetical protein